MTRRRKITRADLNREYQRQGDAVAPGAVFCADCATKDEEIKRLRDAVLDVTKAHADAEQRQAARRSMEGGRS